VTHNRSLAARADRVLSLEGGRLVPLSGVEAMP
jgi:predicted ABC-type transport system involved in lysophospholipase L1 biosynthesis ATPase subunit